MMNRILLILTAVLLLSNLSAQLVIGERSAELEEANYAITGTATILEYDDGTVSFVLSDDFDTPEGPDVRVYLNSDFTTNVAVELANLSTLDHFSGALTLEVPAGTDLDLNDKVVFYCFAFSQLWATGTFGDPVNPNPMNNDTCQASLTATEGWLTQVDLCTSMDGDQSVALKNNIGVSPGEKYAFLLTDTNEVLLEVTLDSVYTFTDGMSSPLRIYGVSYRGALNTVIGMDRQETTAADCYIHSGEDLFLTVNPQGSCPPSSVNELLSAQTRLFPNPSGDYIQLEYPANFQAKSLVVYNRLGQEVLHFNGQLTSQRLDVGQLPEGQYLLIVRDEAGVQLHKPFIKNH